MAILGLVTEMARRINENINKVQLQPLHEALTATGSIKATQSGGEPSKA